MTITYTRKFAAILCLVIPSIVGLVTFSASAAEPTKKEEEKAKNISLNMRN